jgi:hypothetical protein
MATSKLLAGLVLLSLMVASSAFGQQKTFVSDKFKYQLTIPDKWNAQVPESGTPVLFFNYGPNQGLPQGLIADGGAHILVFAVDPMNWIRKLDPSGAERMTGSLDKLRTNVSTVRIPDWSKDPNVPHDISKVRADVGRFNPDDDETQIQVDFRFALKAAAFRVTLNYNKDDPNGSHFESVCESLVRSIRAK